MVASESKRGNLYKTGQVLVLDRAFNHRVVYWPPTGRRDIAERECARLNELYGWGQEEQSGES